jgi:hypothetical protein
MWWRRNGPRPTSAVQNNHHGADFLRSPADGTLLAFFRRGDGSFTRVLPGGIHSTSYEWQHSGSRADDRAVRVGGSSHIPAADLSGSTFRDRPSPMRMCRHLGLLMGCVLTEGWHPAARERGCGDVHVVGPAAAVLRRHFPSVVCADGRSGGGRAYARRPVASGSLWSGETRAQGRHHGLPVGRAGPSRHVRPQAPGAARGAGGVSTHCDVGARPRVLRT